MNSSLLLVFITTSTLSLSAQSLTLSNVSNPMIGPSAVVGDTTTISISGAASNALVTLYYSQDFGSGLFNAGYTDGSGSFQISQVQDSSKIGIWSEQWTVGGANVGPNLNFEIVDKPTSLGPAVVTASSPTACTSPYVYGPSTDIQYQIVGSTGRSESNPISGLSLMLEPFENVVFYFLDGTPPRSKSGDIGPATGFTPPSSQYATSSGIFHDVPVSFCGNGAFAPYHGSDQTISILIGMTKYPVRSQSFTASGTSPGHGSLGNGSDVSFVQ